jgi:hypothetical protein
MEIETKKPFLENVSIFLQKPADGFSQRKQTDGDLPEPALKEENLFVMFFCMGF